MSTEVRVYDNEHGNPVVVMVTTGTFDVSRLVALLNSGRCEDLDTAQRITRAVRRHNGGRAALALLKEHGGPDLMENTRTDDAYIAMLEDGVVASACVIFGEVKGSQADYCTENIHEQASDIVNRVPRLAGAYKGADDA